MEHKDLATVALDTGRSGRFVGDVNAHIHLPPNFSAFQNVDEVVRKASEAELCLAGISNYYDHSRYGDWADLFLGSDIFPLMGTEIVSTDEVMFAANWRGNDSNPGRVYMCGLGTSGILSPSQKAADVLLRIRTKDEARMRDMIVRINTYINGCGVGVVLNEKSMKETVAAACGCSVGEVVLQERHLAERLQAELFDAYSLAGLPNALAAMGVRVNDPTFAYAVQGAIRSSLLKAGMPCYVKEEFVLTEAAVELILELRGIPCYPLLLDGASPLTELERKIGALIDQLRDWNIHMVQLITNRNKRRMAEFYARGLRTAGLAVTIGTEHNTTEMLPLVPECKGGVPLGGKLRSLGWEGACVAAAHQVLGMRGEPGFVDPEGNVVNSIEDMAQIGANILSALASNR